MIRLPPGDKPPAHHSRMHAEGGLPGALSVMRLPPIAATRLARCRRRSAPSSSMLVDRLGSSSRSAIATPRVGAPYLPIEGYIAISRARCPDPEPLGELPTRCVPPRTAWRRFPARPSSVQTRHASDELGERAERGLAASDNSAASIGAISRQAAHARRHRSRAVNQSRETPARCTCLASPATRRRVVGPDHDIPRSTPVALKPPSRPRAPVKPGEVFAVGGKRGSNRWPTPDRQGDRRHLRADCDIQKVAKREAINAIKGIGATSPRSTRSPPRSPRRWKSNAPPRRRSPARPSSVVRHQNSPTTASASAPADAAAAAARSNTALGDTGSPTPHCAAGSRVSGQIRRPSRPVKRTTATVW